MKTTALPAIAAVGALAGVRSSVAPLLAVRALSKRHGRPVNLGAKLLTARLAPRLTGAFATTEAVLDQLPNAPNRTAPSTLAPRVVTGALAGAALGMRRRGSFLVPALIGGAAAVIGAYASLPLRLALAKKVPRVTAGLIEDALVIAAAATLLPVLV